jgi:hypothetical protein
MIRPALMILLFAASPWSSVLAQDAPPRCDLPEHPQFDFWVGDWSVTGKNGNHAGDNTITMVHDGCALREEWRGTSGYHGSSLNFYDRGTHRWHQTWIATDGQPLWISGGIDDEGRMVMASEERDGRIDRIAWTPNADGTVRQLWERTGDGGVTWAVLFDGTYVRKDAPVP